MKNSYGITKKTTNFISHVFLALSISLSRCVLQLTLNNALYGEPSVLMQFHFLIAIIKLTTIYNPFVLGSALLQRMLMLTYMVIGINGKERKNATEQDTTPANKNATQKKKRERNGSAVS